MAKQIMEIKMKSKIEKEVDRKLWSIAGKNDSWVRVLLIVVSVFMAGCFVGWLL